MKIVVAPDSFKGSLTSTQVSTIIRDAVLSVSPQITIVLKPMADGGDGTIDAFLSTSRAKRKEIICTGPLGKKIQSEYILINEQTAVIETALIAGLTLVPENLRNPDYTTSFGIGEVIMSAIDHNCKEVIIGLGGSAINDGGLGMLQAMEMIAYDSDGKRLGPFGKDLLNLSELDFSTIDKRIKDLSIKVICDVDNPLCGKKGATYVYGRQKGAKPEQLKQYDASLKKFASLVEDKLKYSYKDYPGAGAAGGLGSRF